ncbi:RNA12 protein-domain-containing protein [Pisolithus croceorrhizus]|nr:RNA12 protein-domain-containing protein [Pisolithus croceorrhizus]
MGVIGQKGLLVSVVRFRPTEANLGGVGTALRRVSRRLQNEAKRIEPSDRLRLAGNEGEKYERDSHDRIAPVVVIKNYAALGGQIDRTPGSAQSVAHVVVISENRKTQNFWHETACVERLGGRASDLESLIHKVHSGQSIEDAVEDIISRALVNCARTPLAKMDEAKDVALVREQCGLFEAIVAKPETSPSKEMRPLRAMENAELISIVILNGRPSTIRPGRPVLKYVFQQLVHARRPPSSRVKRTQYAPRDGYTGVMDSALVGHRKGSAERTRYLARKMYAAQQKIQTLEKQNAELRRVLDKQNLGMADFDGQGHLLSLKVMRVSRPGLASAWEPFYSSSSSFSARSTASILSLQGKTPLPGHPKTLRDLSHASEFLTLPAAFGAIQLGETFSSCLCVNNEANTDIEGVSIKVEMQTANSKVLLAEVGGTADRRKLAIGDVLEVVVHHEVKELGQHARLHGKLSSSSGFRHTPPGPVAEGQAIQTCRVSASTTSSSMCEKQVSVRSRTRYLSRRKSMSQDLLSTTGSRRTREGLSGSPHTKYYTEPMWFERIDFDCAEGWTATDMNQVRTGMDDSAESTPLFSGSVALMQPQATRQYIYIGYFVAHTFWRTWPPPDGHAYSSDPGPPPPPLQTLPPPQQPASAVPPYLHAGARHQVLVYTPTIASITVGIPGPYRPASPFRNRPVPVPRPQSPAGSIVSVAASSATINWSPANV